jgi:hypothetical protein
VKAIYDNFDTWLTGTIDFTHTDGQLTGGHFKGEKGFDANIVFENDNNGNPVKIKWDFTFGKSQTYTFEYE